VREVVTQVRIYKETLTLFVVDAGSGFDVEHVLEGGASTGLASMRERTDLLGGTLRITSEPGEGTTVEAELPLRQAPLSSDEWAHQSLTKQQNGARDASRNRLRDRQRDTLRDAARDSARDAARDLVRDATYEHLGSQHAALPEQVAPKEPDQ
jgi:hypothetical protein